MNTPSLRLSENGRYLMKADGTLFLYLADTAWGLFHKLNREDALLYLDDRAEKGFTVIQAVALDEADGIRTPNAFGRLPFRMNAGGEWDSTLLDTEPGYSYWDHVRFIVEAAGERGLFIALLPTWGDKFNKGQWGAGPEIFEPENAYVYGRWLGEQYRHTPNIIWVLGGDRLLETRRHFEIICQMAKGLREGDSGEHLITFHPYGGQTSSTPLHREPWLDFNMIQSGHRRSQFNYAMIGRDYSLTPPKPVLDAEPGYEHHPESFDPANGYLDEVDVRQSAYWALLSGACGHTYGDHSIWGFREDPFDQPGFPPGHFCVSWRQALGAPGARQMRHVKTLMLSRPIASARPAPEFIQNQLKGALHIPVLIGDDFLFAYSSQGQRIAFVENAFHGRLDAQWFDPRSGELHVIGAFDGLPAKGFVPPTGGRGQDWVVILDRITTS